jgi:hypothetical protein
MYRGEKEKKRSPKTKPRLARSVSKELKKRWSYFIRKVYETDPLICPKCQGEMRIISFIDQPGVIKKILQHISLWESPTPLLKETDKRDYLRSILQPADIKASIPIGSSCLAVPRSKRAEHHEWRSSTVIRSAGQRFSACFASVQYPGCKTCTPYPPSTQRG